MTDESVQPSPHYHIEGGKVVVVKELTGDIQAAGDVTIAFLDNQSVNLDYLFTKSTLQVRRLLSELELSNRYTPATYEPRIEVEQQIQNFLASPKSGLLIFGESGVGKSSVLAHLCQQLRDSGQIILFYLGSDFFDDLNVEQRILKDSGYAHTIPSLAELLDKLNRLSRTAERPLGFYVLVDSIEHASKPDQLLRVLDQLIGSFSYSWFKVVATIQTGAYTAITSECEKKGWPQPIGITGYFLPDTKDDSLTLRTKHLKMR